MTLMLYSVHNSLHVVGSVVDMIIFSVLYFLKCFYILKKNPAWLL